MKCRSAPKSDRSRGLPRRSQQTVQASGAGKEVRLRNAYVIKAERVEKDAEGNITTIFCTYDADTLSKDPADGRGQRRDPLGKRGACAAGRDPSLRSSCQRAKPGRGRFRGNQPESLVIKQGYAEPSGRPKPVKLTSLSVKAISPRQPLCNRNQSGVQPHRRAA